MGNAWSIISEDTSSQSHRRFAARQCARFFAWSEDRCLIARRDPAP
jgi:hypothetical protein